MELVATPPMGRGKPYEKDPDAYILRGGSILDEVARYAPAYLLSLLIVSVPAIYAVKLLLLFLRQK